MEIKVKVVNKSNNPLPEYEDSGCSGCDVRAALELINTEFLFNADLSVDRRRLIIRPGGRALIPSGLRVAIPEGYEIQVRDRSGIALRNGIMVTNGIGTIDSSYRGDVGVIFTNTGTESFTIEQGERIAQLVLQQVPKIEWVPVEALDKTDRGEGAYGHTGRE